MGVGIAKIRQVKVPVSDLVASTEWYRRLLDLVPVFEFFEDGAVRGVVLWEPDADLHVSLRDRRYCAGDLSGAEVVALKVESAEALNTIIGRCQSLGFSHGDVQHRGPYGAALDVPDPDGTVLRFLYEPDTYPRGFAGLEFGPDGTPSAYRKPRLPAPSG